MTRRSTLVFSGVSLLALLVAQSLLGTTPSDPNTIGLAPALVAAVALVFAIVAWVEGVVLALRARSTLWLVVAVLPFMPINSMMCAMFCPAGPTERRR